MLLGYAETKVLQKDLPLTFGETPGILGGEW